MGTSVNAAGETILVVPCYNEAERLNADAFRSAAARCTRFLFVNDGSTDATADVLADLCRVDPDKLQIHTLQTNSGKAEAVRAGILAACDRGAAYVGFWDADLSTPLEELPLFVEVLETRPDIEMVFGARVNLLGRSIRRKLSRHYIGRIFATSAATALGIPVYDTQCGAKLFRVTDDLVDLFREPFISKWIFDVEIIARTIDARRGTDRPPARDIIYELPLRQWYDVHGSKLRLRDMGTVAVDFLRIYSRYLRRRR